MKKWKMKQKDENHYQIKCKNNVLKEAKKSLRTS